MQGLRISITAALTTMLLLGGCLETADPGEDTDSIEQLTFMGDIGVALGAPVVTGHTAGLTSDFTPTCATSSAPDASYTWTAPSTGSYTFTTAGSSFDTILEIRRINTLVSLGCNDDSGGTLQSTVSVSLNAGETVVIIIDGFSAATGAFHLNIAAGGGGPPLSGMHLWLRADAGIVHGTAPQIFRWLDQSGNGRNGRMETTTRQPSLVGGALNGRSVVRFFGAQSLVLEVHSTPTRFSVFVVGKNSMPSESFSMILGAAGSTPNHQLRWENGSQALFVTHNAGTVITSPIGNTRVYHALSARYDGGTMTWYRDGSAMSSRSYTATAPWTIAQVGAWFSSNFLVGDIAEVIIYDRAVSEAERASVNAYLRSKYSLP
jgi:hypothetical protein